jgi:hypothetical protein
VAETTFGRRKYLNPKPLHIYMFEIETPEDWHWAGSIESDGQRKRILQATGKQQVENDDIESSQWTLEIIITQAQSEYAVTARKVYYDRRGNPTQKTGIENRAQMTASEAASTTRRLAKQLV